MYYRKDSGAPTNTEIGARQSGIYIENVNNIIVDGIDVSGPGASSGFDDWSCVNFKTTLTQPAISILGNSRDIVIKNLMVSKAEGTGVSSMIDSDSITIENVSVTKCGGNGIWIRSANSLIKNCKAYENGREPGDTGDRVGIGIGNCGGTSILVEGNEVYKNGQDDANNDFEISAYGTFGPVYIRNNYVHDCGAGCIQIATSGSPTDASNSEITFNIIDGYGTTTFSGEDPTTGKYSGIRIGDSAGDPDDKVENVKIYNNIISGGGAAAAAHEGAGIAITKEGTNGAMIKNNIFYNNLGAEIMLIYTSGYNISYNLYSNASTWNLDYARKTSFSAWKSTTGQDANSIIGDPLFVNYAGKNFHLQYSSPAIDKGTNVGFSLDRDGTQMPQGVGYDIGAYEYVAGVIPESAPNSIFSQIINWVKEFVKNPWTK